MAFASVVLISLVWIAISYFVCNFRLISIKMINPLPGPKALPLVGSAFYFLQKNPNEILISLLKLMRNYSSPFQVWIGNKLFIGIYEPDQIKIVLQNRHCLNKGVLYKLIEPTLGKASILTAPTSIWTKNRKISALNFNTNMLRGFFDIFVEQSLILADKLKKIELKEREIDLFEPLSLCTMTTAYNTILGVNLDSRLDIIRQCCETIISCKKSLSYRFKNIFLYSNIIFNLTDFGRKQQKSLNFIHSFVDKMIQQRQYALNKSNIADINIENKITHKAFCDVFLESHKEKHTKEDIQNNVLTMLVASAETTAITVNFVIFIFANFPEIQEKAYKELLEIYGMETPRSVPVKYEDLQHMNYLDRVIKETLRLFPVVPVIARQLTEDIRIGKNILPKGADVVLALGKVHRNKKYWPNPLVFDPDRFLPERLENSQSYYYMPFSNGPRNCIGMKYAMISIKVILATLIRTFVFKVDESIGIDKIKLKLEVLLSPLEPLKVKIEKRNFLSERI
ncbi:cytochrome P450 4c21-like [Cataglyphis hispanica]|uniref:cytochrome P450 4c21-like n=1 Tax=Cataglyphis hispanica TaxID=1086592 RepID=UPI00217FD3FB|nr:cytochrome P450 4c21-like [Cataglyphis hispanica]